MILNLLKTRGHSAILVAALCGVACSAAGDDAADNLGEQRQAAICAEPVTQEDRVEEGRWMTSTLNYEPSTGVASVTTTVSNSRSLVGWTGGVVAVFVDAAGAPLYVSDVQTRGVGACLFRCPKQSTLSWSAVVPADLRERVGGVAILHSHTPTNRAALLALKFLDVTQPGCVLAPGYWGVACKIAAAAAKAAIPELSSQTQESVDSLLGSAIESISDRVHLFPTCSSGASLVPVLTGPSAASGSVIQSSFYGSPYEGWRAFDGDANSMWISSAFQNPATIGYAWTDSAKTVRRYALSFANGSLTSRAPKAWTLEGSNGGDWSVVDRRSDETSWLGKDRREYIVANPSAYFQYRLSFTDDNDARAGVVVISLSKVEFFD
jgi:hypothetical protein